jgi:hypothetical protein
VQNYLVCAPPFFSPSYATDLRIEKCYEVQNPAGTRAKQEENDVIVH